MPTLVAGTTYGNVPINQTEPPPLLRVVQAITLGTSDKYVPKPTLTDLEIKNSLCIRDFRQQVRSQATAICLIEHEDCWKYPNTRHPHGEDDSGDIWDDRLVKTVETLVPSLRTGLYDKIGNFSDEKCEHTQTEWFLNDVGFNLTCRLALLCGAETPLSEFDAHLAEQLSFMNKEKDWVLVPTDKTNCWIPCLLVRYVGWVKRHLQQYCSKIQYSRLKVIEKECFELLDKCSHLMDEGERGFLRSSIESHAIPSARILIKDHKPVDALGDHWMRLLVSAKNFTQGFSKLAYKAIQDVLDQNGIE